MRSELLQRNGPMVAPLDEAKTTDLEQAAAVPQLALRPKDAARSLGVGARMLWTMTASGQIPHVRLGRRILYPLRELQDWLTKRATGGSRR